MRSMIRLVAQCGSLAGQSFALPPDTEVAIGRSPDCFVRIQGRDISRCHATLVPSGKGHILKDATHDIDKGITDIWAGGQSDWISGVGIHASAGITPV